MVDKRGPVGGRVVWSSAGRRLWDRDSVEWEDTGRELNRVEAERVLMAPGVEVAVSEGGGGPVRWLDGPERLRVWREEIAPNFHDQPGWRPPSGAPRAQPFHATVWRHRERWLLLLTDFA